MHTFDTIHHTDTQSTLMSKVYMWMAGGLALTGVIARGVAINSDMITFLMSNSILFYGLLIGEVALVWYLSASIHKLSSQSATLLFLLYAAINGVTMSLIFMIYTTSSIASTFLVTAGTFAVMSFYGYVTKTDLSSVGNILLMALVWLIIASIVNLFWTNDTLTLVISYAWVLIFIWLTAYDTQKIKESISSDHDEESMQKNALMGALTLYLDFINLFLMLLRLLGDRRR